MGACVVLRASLLLVRLRRIASTVDVVCRISSTIEMYLNAKKNTPTA